MRRFALLIPAVVALSGVVACSSDEKSSESTPCASCPLSSGGSAGSAGSGAAAAGGMAGAGAGGTGGSEGEPFSVPVFDDVRISSLGDDENFQNATSDFDWGEGPYAKATLVVDLATTCFPFEGRAVPPPGHNWPADCDAFDRNFEFILDDPADAETDPPGIELVRAITPFGGPMHLEIDITDVVNGLPGSHTLRTHIATWPDGSGQVTGSAGGWNVTARVDLEPGPAPREVLAVIPLFNGSQGPDVIEPVSFTVPEGTTSSRVEYRVTGHGGQSDPMCIGPADEFCKRAHRIFVDGEQIGPPITPWRDDCAELCTIETFNNFDYCAENPNGAIQSVEAPRANWCPGDVTPPIVFEESAYSNPGEHSFGWTVQDVKGSWRTSVVYFAFGG